MKKHTNLASKSMQIWFLNLDNTIAGGVLWENSEHKIIYAEKRVIFFENNAE